MCAADGLFPHLKLEIYLYKKKKKLFAIFSTICYDHGFKNQIRERTGNENSSRTSVPTGVEPMTS
jgi:hypothetical protein